MLEKNFAALLSNALADIAFVDLNFFSVQRLLNPILRPLEHITKAVTKISRVSSEQKGDDSTAAPASTIDVESVPRTKSSDEDEEMMPTKEDAPDLYQNSALGLYEANWSLETEIIRLLHQKKRINLMMTMQIQMIWMIVQCYEEVTYWRGR